MRVRLGRRPLPRQLTAAVEARVDHHPDADERQHEERRRDGLRVAGQRFDLRSGIRGHFAQHANARHGRARQRPRLLERLGEARPATIRLNPEDFARTAAGRLEQWAAAHVSVVSDPSVSRGGCIVESPFGFVDAGIEAQLQELAGALLESSQPGFEGNSYV